MSSGGQEVLGGRRRPYWARRIPARVHSVGDRSQRPSSVDDRESRACTPQAQVSCNVRRVTVLDPQQLFSRLLDHDRQRARICSLCRLFHVDLPLDILPTKGEGRQGLPTREDLVSSGSGRGSISPCSSPWANHVVQVRAGTRCCVTWRGSLRSGCWERSGKTPLTSDNAPGPGTQVFHSLRSGVRAPMECARPRSVVSK